MLPRARRGLAASVMGIALALSGLPAFPPAVTIAAAPNVAAAADPGPSVCAGAVFQFPLRGGRLGWMFGDPRASGTDPSVIHSGIDLWPGAGGSNVYPFASGTVTAVGAHSLSIYYPVLGGVMTYITDLNLAAKWLNTNWTKAANVTPDEVLGTMDGNHVHFSIRHTTSHYNDQSKLVGADGVTYFLDVREGGTRTDGGQDPSDLFNARLAIPVAHRDVSTSNDVYADGITGTEYPHLATDFCNSASPIAPGAGNSVTITKSVLTPKIPATPDVVFLADTTGSMGDAIDNVRSNATSVMNQVLSQQPSAWFGAAEYKDFNCDAYPYWLDQGLTSSTTDVQSAIDANWVANGGCDTPEAQLNALYTLATDGGIGWRSGSTRIVAWFGDSPGHDPSNGHSLADVIAALQAAHIRVVAVNVWDLDGCGDSGAPCGQATAIANATGGSVLTLASAGIAAGALVGGDNAPGQANQNGAVPAATTDDGDVASAILEGLSTLPTTVVPSANCGSGVDVTIDPPTETVTSGDTASFTVTISAAGSIDSAATSACDVAFAADGQTITDPAVVEPIVIYPPVAPRYVDFEASSTYQAIAPVRILDSRSSLGDTTLVSRTKQTLNVTGSSTGVPAAAVAVTGNLTIVGQTALGYVSLAPSLTSGTQPGTSTINFPVGDIRANGVTVPLSDSGTIDVMFWASSTTDTVNVLFDVTGYFSAS
jgi:hypothetical protein